MGILRWPTFNDWVQDENSISQDEAFVIRQIVEFYKYKSFLDIGTHKLYVPLCVWELVVEEYGGEIDTVDFIPNFGSAYHPKSIEKGFTKAELWHIHKKNERVVKYHHNINLFTCGSDSFFRKNKKTYDCIHIDGDHHYEQVKKDFFNALVALKDDGTIIMHDANLIHYGVHQFVHSNLKFGYHRYLHDTERGQAIIRLQPLADELITECGLIDFESFANNS